MQTLTNSEIYELIKTKTYKQITTRTGLSEQQIKGRKTKHCLATFGEDKTATQIRSRLSGAELLELKKHHQWSDIEKNHMKAGDSLIAMKDRLRVYRNSQHIEVKNGPKYSSHFNAAAQAFCLGRAV